MLLMSPQLVKSFEEPVDIRLKIDDALNEISSVLSFVTFTKVAYTQISLYVIVFICYALIYVRNHKEEKLLEKEYGKSKDLALQIVKVERF